MHRRNCLLLAAAAATLGTGCASPEVASYAAERPPLVLEDYSNSRLRAWGMFSDRSGKVVKRFTVDLVGTWREGAGTLEEDFVFSDGTRQRRVWRIRALGDGRYTGMADDVVGEASGLARGNALHWNYVLALPVDGRTWHVDMDDWMYLMDDGVLLNRTVMRKFGIRLGEVTIAFRRLP